MQAADFSHLLLGSLLTPGSAQRDAQIVVGLFEIGFEGDGLPEVLDGARGVARELARHAEVVPVLRIAAVRLDGGLELGERALLVAEAAQANSKPFVRL